MKAKRLRALLFAGLLSLAPAVTLTSCSGGGDSGGDAPVNEQGVPTSLNQLVVTANFNDQSVTGQSVTGTMRISFIGNNSARVEFIHSNDPNKSWSATGFSKWVPNDEDGPYAHISQLGKDNVDGTEEERAVDVDFVVRGGKMIIDGVAFDAPGRGWVMASSYTLQ